MDYQQYFDKLFRIRSKDLSKKSYAAQNKFLSEMADINALTTSSAVSGLLKLLIDDIREYCNLFIQCLKETFKVYPTLADSEHKELSQMLSRHIKVYINENNNRLSDFIQSSPFSGTAGKSFLSGYEYGVNEILNDASDEIELFLKEIRFSNRSEKKQISEQSTSSLNSNTIWQDIEKEFGVSKQTLGKKLNFIKDKFKKSIIFRDIEQAFVLANMSFSKPAVVLAGSVIEELLRLYLEKNNITVQRNDFNNYIKACEENGLLKSAVSRLSDSVRHFRNLVHLAKEESERFTISKATAKGAISSIFTISNDF